MDTKDTNYAIETYNTLLEAIKANGWACKYNESNLTIKYTVIGNGINTEYYVLVDEKNQLVWLYTVLPFAFDATKITDGAVAVSMVNFNLDCGNFDLDVKNGKVKFKMVTSYRDSKLAAETLSFLLLHSAATVEEFGKRLRDFAQGKTAIETFLK